MSLLSNFPSPSGTLYSSMKTLNGLLKTARLSVPFGDSLFLNLIRKDRHGNVSIFFPSPSGTLYSSIYWGILWLWLVPIRLSVPFGDSLFLNKRQRLLLGVVYNFPSPSGTLYSSIPWHYKWTRRWNHTFRPLRGLSIPQCLVKVIVADIPNAFRPLRGLSIPQWSCQAQVIETQNYSFRPLRGLSIPQCYRAVPAVKGQKVLSVPFGDSLFLNNRT